MDSTSLLAISIVAASCLILAAVLAHKSDAVREFLGVHWLHIGFFVASVVGLAFAWTLLSKPNQTPLESQVFSFLLFVFSVAASWVFSKMYAEQSASNSLRDYSVQVARGVMVLKAQLEVLTNWVGVKRATASGPIDDAQLEHIEESLKGFRSLADATLRGIAGVMGDALKQYQDTLNEINNTRSEATKEAAKLQAEIASPIHPSDVSKAELAAKLQELELRTIQKIEALAQRSSLPIDLPPALKMVPVDCPVCHSVNEIQIADGFGQTRSAVCRTCSARFNLHTSGSGAYFTRLISTPSSAGTTEPAHPISEVPVILREVGFNYASGSFVEALNVIARTARGLEEAGSPYSINKLMQGAIGALDATSVATATIVRRIIQLLFWGRLFKFSEPPSFNSAIVNAITRDEMLVTFFHSVGYKLAEKSFSVDFDASTEQVSRYLSPLLNEQMTVRRLLEELRLRYDERLHRNDPPSPTGS